MSWRERRREREVMVGMICVREGLGGQGLGFEFGYPSTVSVSSFINLIVID